MKLKAIDKNSNYLIDDHLSDNFCEDLEELLELYEIVSIKAVPHPTCDDSVISITFSDGTTRDLIQDGGIN